MCEYADLLPGKLIDLKNDPTEENDISGNPEYADLLAELSKSLEGMPSMDNDPKHGRLPEKSWWKKRKTKSKVHKRGKP